MSKILTILIAIVIITDHAVAQSKVLINEFLVDPQPQLVELINTGTDAVDISGWIIDESGGTTFYTIPQSSILNPGFCLVLSSDFNLNKSSPDTIRLLKNSELIDYFSYKSSSGSGNSFFRLPDGENNWATGSTTLGYYNQSSLSCLFIPSPTLTESSSPTEIPSPTPYTLNPISLSYDNIYISEVMVNPESGKNEWVEIFNNNDFAVSLTNWYIDDLENTGTTPRLFSLDIPSKSYKVFNLTSSIFNNDGDSVRLLDLNKNLKDDFEYIESTQGKTFGRITIDNDGFCLQEQSYEFKNNSCINPTPSLTPTQPPAKTITPSKSLNTTNMPTNKPLNYKKSITYIETYDPENILGISNSQNYNNFLSIRLLTFVSFSYSLLTIIMVLFKIKSIYAKIEKLFSSFIYTE